MTNFISQLINSDNAHPSEMLSSIRRKVSALVHPSSSSTASQPPQTRSLSNTNWDVTINFKGAKVNLYFFRLESLLLHMYCACTSLAFMLLCTDEDRPTKQRKEFINPAPSPPLLTFLFLVYAKKFLTN